jgi:hypothetical protein
MELLVTSDKDFVTEMNRRFAEAHNYTDDYQCLNYSEDYQIMAESLGFRSDIVVGTYDNKSKQGHAWNCLYLEPQTGEFKNFDKYNNTAAYANIEEWRKK